MLAEPQRLYPEPAALADLDAVIAAAAQAALDAYSVVARIHAERAHALARLARAEVAALDLLGTTTENSYAAAHNAARARYRVGAIAGLAREVACCAKVARSLEARRATFAARRATLAARLE